MLSKSPKCTFLPPTSSGNVQVCYSIFFRESRTTYITEANNLINRKLDHLMNHLLELKDSVSQKQTTAKLVCNDETPKIFSYTASGLLSVLKYPSKNESNSNERVSSRVGGETVW